MIIRIIKEPIRIDEAKEIAREFYQIMVKGVVDVERGIVALGGEYHIDANNRLIEEGSSQSNLWGFNIHFDKLSDDWIEYRSLINIRPATGNRSVLIRDEDLQRRVREVVEALIIRS